MQQRTLAFLAKQLKRDLAEPRRPIVDVTALRAEAANLETRADHLDRSARALNSDEVFRFIEAAAAGYADGDAPELPSDHFEETARHLRETAALIRGFADRLRRKRAHPEELAVEMFVRLYGGRITLYEAAPAVLDLQDLFARAGKPISAETAKSYLRKALKMPNAQPKAVVLLFPQ